MSTIRGGRGDGSVVDHVRCLSDEGFTHTCLFGVKYLCLVFCLFSVSSLCTRLRLCLLVLVSCCLRFGF